jgi:photosystem II oxygen-evolving enhancer protein 2
MVKRVLALLLMVVWMTIGQVPTALAAGGLKSYADNIDGYEFLYPNGWVEVNVTNGPDIVFHDLINVTDNISVVINPIASDKTLSDLGSPSEVGYKLSKAAIAPPNSGREAELVNAAAREVNGQTYYILEYAVKLPNGQQRHNLASAVVRRGQLYTFNASVAEQRWIKSKAMLDDVVQSFKTY